MPSFSRKSMSKLRSCDYRLQELFLNVVKEYDCTIIQGHRTKEEQDEYYNNKRSKVQWPNSKHNHSPSLAADVAPWVNGSIPWPQIPKDSKFIHDTAQFYHFAGFVLSRANSLGIDVRWGGDWDSDHNFSDQKFDDLVHFEIVDQ